MTLNTKLSCCHSRKSGNPVYKALPGSPIKPAPDWDRVSGMISPRKKGLSLIEIILYVALLGLLLVAVVNLTLTITTVYAKARVVRAVNQQAVAGMERMVRSIQLAYRVDTSQSILSIHPGRLVIDTIITPTSIATTSRRFLLSGNTLALEEGVAPAVALTNGVQITNLVFHNIDTGSSGRKAVRIEMTASAGQGKLQTAQTFYGTAVLRGSY